jgi:hypothetical protein
VVAVHSLRTIARIYVGLYLDVPDPRLPREDTVAYGRGLFALTPKSSAQRLPRAA